MKTILHLLATQFTLTLVHTVRANDFADQCADRTAIKRVYHTHRTGTKQPFEQAMPQMLIKQIVHDDQRKEAVLRKVYDITITPDMIAVEVQRMEATTRAPEVLAEIKNALGNDAARFAEGMARPIVVERELHRRFDNDDKLHATRRREAEHARERLLTTKPVANMHDMTWQLAPNAAQHSNVEPGVPGAASPAQENAKSAAYTNEATAQIAQPLTSAVHGAPDKEKLYLDDLDPELQNVLRVQLQKRGDVSAVIELASSFLVFLTKERTAEILSAAVLTINKRSYEEWLAQQPSQP